METLVPELKVELRSKVSLRTQCLQTHGAKYTMEIGQKEKKLLSKPAGIVKSIASSGYTIRPQATQYKIT